MKEHSRPEEQERDALDLSLVIPVYDEIDCLPRLLEEILAVMASRSESWEVLFIDDGSTDGSGEWLDRRAEENERIRVVHFAANAGQSAAFIAGFHRARGRWIVTLDADGQNPPGEIPKVLDARTPGVDLVVGYREHRRDSWWRLFQSRWANAIRNALSGESIRDTGCSLKAFRAHHLRRVPPFRGMHRFLPTLCRLVGAHSVVEVAVGHRARQGGEAKYGMWGRALPALCDLFAVRWMQSRWIGRSFFDEDER